MKKLIRLAQKNREADPKSWERLYENLIIKKIRKRYTVNQELAILRQREEKPAEFKEYNSFVENCKAEAKAELGLN